jgi:glycine reductase
MNLPWRLELETHEVRQLAFGSETRLTDRVLTLDRTQLDALLKTQPTIADVEIALAHPGDDVRIVHLLDAIEPRFKERGRARIFPGLLGDPIMAGEGRTHRLAGMAILATAEFPVPVGGLLQAREAIVDMSGPTAQYSLFSSTANLVLHFIPAPGAGNAEFDAAIRHASLRLAEFLAQSATDHTPDKSETFDLTPAAADLPRIVYLYQAQAQGTFSDTYLYGTPIHNLVPTLLHPNETMDGAIVSGNYVYACFKNPTYLHLNNPVIRELYAAHGKTLNFAGIVLYRGHNYTQAEKHRAANYAAKLARMLDADGVVLTGEGGGNSAIDMMLALQECERLGIKTTVITYELGGPEGKDFPLVDSVPEANAIVSTGSCDKVIQLASVAQSLGGELYLDTALPATGAREIVLEKIYCSTNQLGAATLRAQAY